MTGFTKYARTCFKSFRFASVQGNARRKEVDDSHSLGVGDGLEDVKATSYIPVWRMFFSVHQFATSSGTKPVVLVHTDIFPRHNVTVGLSMFRCHCPCASASASDSTTFLFDVCNRADQAQAANREERMISISLWHFESRVFKLRPVARRHRQDEILI